MTSILWWSRLVNSARFIDNIVYELNNDRSVMLLFGSEIPWEDIMIDTIIQKLECKSGRTSEIHDVSDADSAGEYLLKHFCSKDEQAKFWPTTHESPEKYLSISTKTTIHKRYVFLTGIKQENALMWTHSVTEYLKNCDDTHEHGVFIIIIKGVDVPDIKYLTTFRYNDYVTDYDCMMLCLTLVSELKCSRSEKMYLCEVASNIAHNNVELASMLVASSTDLIKHPYEVTKNVFEKNEIKLTKLDERVRTAVWEAQIKLIFPKIENIRAELIRKYENRISHYLPIKSSNNDIVDKASDLEIGQLFHICKENRSQNVIDPSKFEILKKMRDARNALAHLETLSYSQLMETGVFNF